VHSPLKARCCFINTIKSITQEQEVEKGLLEEYWNEMGWNLVPAQEGSKKLPNGLRISDYFSKRTEPEIFYNIYLEGKDFNLVVITGKISNLTIIDIDQVISEEKALATNTAIVRTATEGHWHLYFTGATETRKYNGVEVKGERNWCLIPNSRVGEKTYEFITPLSNIKPLPDLQKLFNQLGIEIEKRKSWTYHGNAKCIEIILARDLQEGEREQALFILKNLLAREGNKKEYIERVIRNRNSGLTKPLRETELSHLLKERTYGKLGCEYIKSNLSFIDCAGCKYREKEVLTVDFKPILFDKELTDIDKQVAFIMLIEEENNITKIANEIKVDRKQVYRSIEKLKKLGALSG